MAVAFRASSYGTTTTSTSITGTEPTGTVQNDLLLAVYQTSQSVGSVNMPAGWTSLSAGVTTTPESCYLVCYIIRGASAPALTFSQNTGSFYYSELHILSFSGVDTTYPIDAYSTTPSINSASNNPNPPSATAISSAAMAIAIGINTLGSATGGWTAPSGYTMRSDNTAANNWGVATKLLSASGAEDPGAFANAVSTATDSWAATLLLAPSGASAPSAAPLLQTEFETGWADNTTPKTVSVTVNATTDVLVVTGIAADSNTVVSTPTGGTGVSWTLHQSDNTNSYCGTWIWSATNISPQTFTMSVAGVGGFNYGFSVLRFANAAVGASNKAQSASGAPSVNITTTQANSAIVVATNDWNAAGGAYTWRTNAGTVTEQTYAHQPTQDDVYVGVHPNAGAVGTYAVGLTAPTAMKYNIVALEIKGNAAAAPSLVAWISA